jgi:hypothetical protein
MLISDVRTPLEYGRTTENMAMGIRHPDYVVPSIRKRWH